MSVIPISKVCRVSASNWAYLRQGSIQYPPF